MSLPRTVLLEQLPPHTTFFLQRETEKDRQRLRKTDKDRKTERDRQRQRKTDRETEKDREKDRDRDRDSIADKATLTCSLVSAVCLNPSTANTGARQSSPSSARCLRAVQVPKMRATSRCLQLTVSAVS